MSMQDLSQSFTDMRIQTQKTDIKEFRLLDQFPDQPSIFDEFEKNIILTCNFNYDPGHKLTWTRQSNSSTSSKIEQKPDGTRNIKDVSDRKFDIINN